MKQKKIVAEEMSLEQRVLLRHVRREVYRTKKKDWFSQTFEARSLNSNSKPLSSRALDL